MTEDSRGPVEGTERDELAPGQGDGRPDASGSGSAAGAAAERVNGRGAVGVDDSPSPGDRPVAGRAARSASAPPETLTDHDPERPADAETDTPPSGDAGSEPFAAGSETGRADAPAGPLPTMTDSDQAAGFAAPDSVGGASDEPSYGGPAQPAPGGVQQDAYAASNQEPYGPPAAGGQEPYGTPGMGGQEPYRTPGAGGQDPYAAAHDASLEDGRARPAFAPHDQDPRSAGVAGQYGWGGQASPQPPPPGARPPMGGPPPAPGAPRPLPHAPGAPGGPAPAAGGPGGTVPGAPGGPGAFGQPPGGPNWAPVPAPPSAGRGGPGLGVLALIGLLIALVAGGFGAGIVALGTSDDNGGGSSVNLGSGNDNAPVQNRPPDSVAGVAQRVLPSVVMIRVSGPNGEDAAGTGFIVNDGYIITNNHVVSGLGAGASIRVVFNDKSSLPATVKGTDPSSDVAVIKPSGSHALPPLALGDSDKLAVGDPVIAIGSPLGLQGSVTTGIVSSLNRAVPTRGEGGGDSTVMNAIQTDAAINPGNSGGPLVDAKGRVIGMNTAILTGGADQQGSIGLGFAIPVNQAKRVAEDIINTGTVKQAKLGVLPDPQWQGGGAKIMAQPVQGTAPITKGGPADRAGIKAGDVITKVDGRPIENASDLIATIRSKAPGNVIKVTYLPGGKGQEKTVDVTLAAG
ncbi:trypsin-like peptidase domain-containing protein [Actinomadura oligospora]|uniref:trypsin-like peptidase domain-containing protein n=1 Tax=Actinomadura oligospora TaxID=111804 RepID=UPI0004AD090C|nr:trypsin-like peptidase domain-containing protein [Actinomadura oligospora]